MTNALAAAAFRDAAAHHLADHLPDAAYGRGRLSARLAHRIAMTYADAGALMTVAEALDAGDLDGALKGLTAVGGPARDRVIVDAWDYVRLATATAR